MAKSPLLSKEDIVNLAVKIDGKELKSQYLLRSVEVVHEINKIPFAEIVLKDGDPTDNSFEASESKDFVPGNELEVLAGYGSKNKSIFKGIIVSHRIRLRSSGASLIVRCADKATTMTVGRKSLYFLKAKDSDVIGKVIKANGLKAKATATSFQHPEIIQYYSTDWDFVLKRAEVNGQLVTVKAGEVTVAPPKFSDAASIKVTYGLDILSFDGDIDARTQIPSVSASAWDMKTQKMVKGDSKEPTVNKQGDLKGKALATDIGLKKAVELQTSGTVPEAMLKEWASAELLKSRLSRIRGQLSFQGNEGAEPGGTLEIEGMGTRFNGTAYISRVQHIISNGDWITTVDMGLPRWHSDQKVEANGPPAAGLLPPISGLQTAVVKSIEKDPDGEFRIQVDVPVIAPSGDGVWARMGHFYASKEIGLFFMPEIGDEVILGFINDDPRYPVILGMMYSSKIKAPYTPEKKNSIKALVTKSKIKLEFDDEKKILIIETPGGNRVTLSDDAKSILMEDQNKNTVELSDKGITLKSAKDVTIDATGELKLLAKGKITVDSKQDVAIAGLNIEGNAKVGMKMAGNAKAEFTASGQVTVKGAMVMIN